MKGSTLRINIQVAKIVDIILNKHEIISNLILIYTY